MSLVLKVPSEHGFVYVKYPSLTASYNVPLTSQTLTDTNAPVRIARVDAQNYKDLATAQSLVRNFA